MAVTKIDGKFYTKVLLELEPKPVKDTTNIPYILTRKAIQEFGEKIQEIVSELTLMTINSNDFYPVSEANKLWDAQYIYTDKKSTELINNGHGIRFETKDSTIKIGIVKSRYKKAVGTRLMVFPRTEPLLTVPIMFELGMDLEKIEELYNNIKNSALDIFGDNYTEHIPTYHP